MTNINDYELLMLVRENNEDAYKLLYEKYDRIIKIILKQYIPYIKTFNIDSNELYNRCLMYLHEAIENYDDNKGATFNTFATFIIRRKIKEYIMRSRKTYLEDSYDEIIVMDNTYDPLLEVEMLDKLERINGAIKNSLSKFESKVMSYMLDGKSYDEIIKILNKDPKQVYNAIYRIKKKLLEV